MNVIHVDFKIKKISKKSDPVRAKKYDDIRIKCAQMYQSISGIEKNQAFLDHTKRCLNAIADGYAQIFYQK